MAFKTLITSQVNNAFRLIGDLGEDITFSNVQAEDYNFSTGETEEIYSLDQTLRCLVSRQEAISDPNPRIQLDCLIKSDDINSDELDNYDLVNLRGKSWTINSFEDDGFIIYLKLSRKV